jgi:hypothetical protein
MGLFGLMPGEWDAPQAQGGWQDRMGGILSGDNQLANIGLGILANNNSRNFGEVVGKGALYGMQQTQQNRRYAEDQKYRQAQMKRYEREDKNADALEASHNDFDTKFPEYKGLSRLNPAAAMKIAYPNAASNTADPYFTPVSTSTGLGSYNNRTGGFEMVTGPDGRPIIKAVDSPELQGRISANKSFGENLYQPTDMQDGTIKTKSQLAIDAGAPPINQLPQINPQQLPQLPQGAPVFPSQLPQNGSPQSMQIPPELQQQRDGVRKQMLLAEQAQYGGQGANPSLDAEIANMNGLPQRQSGGIRVPTKAQQAAATEAAKFKAETEAKAQINLPNVIQESENTVKLVDDLLKAPGFKQAVGGSRMFGLQNVPGTQAKDFDVRLEQLKGKQFLQAYESLKGAGAITDIEGTKAGNAISRMDASTTEEEFAKAANEFKDIIKQGAARARAKAGGGNIIPSNEPMPKRNRADILKQYGVTK